jgi:hypothetical protein
VSTRKATAKGKKITFPKSMDAETRRRRLSLVDRESLTMAVLAGKPLEEHERLFIASLLNPILQKKRRGKPKSTVAALKADEIAEKYFIERALFPHAKHKEEIAPSVASMFGVSSSYVDKVLKGLDPKRRLELESNAAAVAEAAQAVWIRASSRRTP